MPNWTISRAPLYDKYGVVIDPPGAEAAKPAVRLEDTYTWDKNYRFRVSIEHHCLVVAYQERNTTGHFITKEEWPYLSGDLAHALGMKCAEVITRFKNGERSI